MVRIKNKIKVKKEIDEFGFVVPKKFNFKTLADVEKEKKSQEQVKKDHEDIISVIGYKPQVITYKKFKGTKEELEKSGYREIPKGWIRKVDGGRFHAIIKDNFIYLHKDKNRKGKHIAILEGVKDEMKRILTYRVPPKIITPAKVEFVQEVRLGFFERIWYNIFGA